MNEAILLGSSLFKALILTAIIWLAYKWSQGKLDKPIKKVKSFKKEYGIMTAFLVVVWWLLTPSFGPDDFIALWVWAKIGTPLYLLIIFTLTVYLLYRLKNVWRLWRKK